MKKSFFKINVKIFPHPRW